MSSLSSLKACKTLGDLAKLLNMKASGLSYILYVVPDAAKYQSFDIPKKSGGTRTIDKPIESLKQVQRRLANLLNSCLHEIEAGVKVDEHCALAHGFHIKRSIVTNARRHRNRRYVFNVDLEDFFGSIHFGRVQGYFEKNKFFQLSKSVATLIAQIACHRGRLPQGSPCSPVITNLICQIMDAHLGKLAGKNRCTYTRYADDLTFSTDVRNFPEVIGVRSTSSEDVWSIGDELRSRAYRSGFKFQTSKTRMQFRDGRQTATGLIVNERLGVPSEFWKTTRAMCHQLFATGTYYLPEDKGRASKQAKNGMPQLRGRLAHVFLVKGFEAGYRKHLADKAPGFVRQYKRFLDFISFYNCDLPTIICEGKTDPIYIQNAIKAQAAAYPNLLMPALGGMRVNLRFFSYSRTTASVQGLSGGAGELAPFILQYASALKAFAAPGKVQPVIIVVDNDSASKPVFNAIKSVTKAAVVPDGSAPFYHVCENLYVVPIPKIAGAETEIEDLFDAAALAMDLNGKTFHRLGAGFDPKLHIGKALFAEHIVQKRRDEIDFTGFVPVIDAIASVLAHYAATLAAAAVPTS